MDEAWRTHIVNAPDDALDLLGREWLLTNGSGAYAMGTAAGVNTRRYHALLVAAAQPPVGRVVALAQMFEQLLVQGDAEPLEFAACAFHDEKDTAVFAPHGYESITHFEKGLSARWAYKAAGVGFTRELFVHWKAQAATIVYEIEGLKQPATLRLAPMLTMRDFHSLARQDDGPFSVEAGEDQVTVRRGDTAVALHCAGAAWEPLAGDNWWHDIYYEWEHQRGHDDREDYYVPGRYTLALEPGSAATVTLTVALGDAAAEPDVSTDARAAHLAPIADKLAPAAAVAGGDRLAASLAIASDDFVVDRTIKGEKLSTILAGYPWFADWGRDTFIALPGLLLCTGRFDEASATLKAFAGALHQGLVPNRFDDYDDNAAHYNTVDASLWFVQAAMAYYRATGDDAAWRDWLAGACQQVIEAYLKGTMNDIKMAGDGLIAAGNVDTQLTWMDAARDGTVFTPRHGKAVEINALWYSALAGMAELVKPFDKQASGHYTKLTGRIRRSFIKVFWDDERGYLYDHVYMGDDDQMVIDTKCRPNQIFVAALADSPLPRTKQTKIVKAVRDRLLTPMGLRTLPVDDPHYHGRYGGSPFDRDEAYHQGTVWPWLIGPYAEAVLRTGQFSDASKKEALDAITPLLDFMAGEGVGQLNEIHEGDPPHAPSGCIAQAWSVAEVVRVLTLIEKGE